MSIPTQGSSFAIGEQPDKSTAGGYVAPTNFYKARLNRLNFGAKEMNETYPFQIGGNITTPGVYKSGEYGEGTAEMIFTLDGFLGHVLKGVVGSVTTTTDAKWDEAANAPETTLTTAGVNTHVFTFDTAGEFIQPWYSVRATVPGVTAADTWAEEGVDAKFGNLRLNVPGAGLVTGSVGLQARKVDFPPAATANAWTYANANFDEAATAAHVGTGSIKIGGVQYPFTQASIELINNLTKPDQEMVIGDLNPDDFVCLSRAINIRLMYKWENPALYRAILQGETPSGSDWNPLPFIKDTVGTDAAFDLTFYSAGDTSVAGVPYMFKMQADRVALQIDQQGIDLAPQNIIMVPINLTVIAPPSGSEFVRMVLVNEVANYDFVA